DGPDEGRAEERRPHRGGRRQGQGDDRVAVPGAPPPPARAGRLGEVHRAARLGAAGGDGAALVDRAGVGSGEAGRPLYPLSPATGERGERGATPAVRSGVDPGRDGQPGQARNPMRPLAALLAAAVFTAAARSDDAPDPAVKAAVEKGLKRIE